MALLTVLLLLSLTLALSYAAMRSQGTASMIQRNSDRRASARQDAITGLSMALKKMNRSDWGGVGTSLNGTLSTTDTFLVTYTSRRQQPKRRRPRSALSGDAAVDGLFGRFAAGTEHRHLPGARGRPPHSATGGRRALQLAHDAEIHPLPNGHARNGFGHPLPVHRPCATASKARHRLPLSQQRFGAVAVHFRLERYATGRLVRLSTVQRSGESPVRWARSKVLCLLDTRIRHSGQQHDRAESGLGLGHADLLDHLPNLSRRTNLYGPGSTGTLRNQTLQPDPTNNPLGLFFTSGNVTINSNVTVNGSLFCGGNITIAGTKVFFNAVALPPMAGTTGPVRLAAAGCQNFTVNTAAGGQVTGPLAVFNSFQIQQGSVSMAFSVAGQLVARQITIQQRTEWNQLNWGNCYTAFQTAKLLFPLTVKYFPDWMNKNYACNPASQLNFGPESPAATYHWASSYNPIFVPNPSDGGLRWDLLTLDGKCIIGKHQGPEIRDRSLLSP